MLKTILILSLPLVLMSKEIDVVKVSEAMGHIIGKNLDALGLDFDLEAIVKGLKEESEGKTSPMNDDECVQAIGVLQDEKMASILEEEFEQVDAISNGDQIKDDEDYPFSTTDTAKHR